MITAPRDVLIRLVVTSTKTIHNLDPVITTFTLHIGYCPPDFQGAVSGTYETSFYIRSPDQVLVTFDAFDTRHCTHTFFEATLSGEILPTPEFRFTTTDVWEEPIAGSLSGLYTTRLESVGVYLIKVSEHFNDDDSIAHDQWVKVEILDPCTLSLIDASSSFI